MGVKGNEDTLNGQNNGRQVKKRENENHLAICCRSRFRVVLQEAEA